ncbi:hypothetical protein SNE40_009025 [Patella caerulea]|uniref:Uncharacterized protein n=1 Tax=Patella caerulea TaxID=87958 RepID=A0AAN8PRF1_PATCE
MTCSRCRMGALLVSFVVFIVTVVGMATQNWHKEKVNEKLWGTYYYDEVGEYVYAGIPVSTKKCVTIAFVNGISCFVFIVLVVVKETKCNQILSVVCGILAGVFIFIGVGILVPYLSPRFGYSFYVALSGGILYIVSGILMLVDMRMNKKLEPQYL